MKTLVIGGSGFVGQYLIEYFDAIGTSSSGKKGFEKLDLHDEAATRALIERLRPELIINCNGITNVEACELNPEDAYLINGESVKELALISKSVNAKLVYVSTDFVFDGKKGNYTEDSGPNPINEYGKSKLIGEKYSQLCDSIVLRISSPYGINYAKNKDIFMDYITKNLKARHKIDVASDQFTTPTFVQDIPIAIGNLVEAGQGGIFHLGSKDRASRYQFSLAVAKIFNLDEQYIKSISVDELKFHAKRPKDTSLNSRKIGKFVKLKSIENNLEIIADKYLKMI